MLPADACIRSRAVLSLNPCGCPQMMPWLTVSYRPATQAQLDTSSAPGACVVINSGHARQRCDTCGQ